MNPIHYCLKLSCIYPLYCLGGTWVIFSGFPSSQLIIEFSIFSVNKWNAIQVFNTRHSFLMTNDHNLGGSRDPRPAMVQPSAGWIWSWAMECPEALAPQGCKPWNKASWRLSWAMPWPWGWLILGFFQIGGQQYPVVIAGLDFPRVARNSFSGKLHFCWKKQGFL